MRLKVGAAATCSTREGWSSMHDGAACMETCNQWEGIPGKLPPPCRPHAARRRHVAIVDGIQQRAQRRCWLQQRSMLPH